ncbi:MAG: hypothetical protein EOO89_14330 [Pedobacter sp.]|nr:MAG: hypothetical protein EOO89_14330 [Pedobacter sp.]
MKVSINLPKAHPAQRKILASKARFRVLMAGRRFGKSLIVQRECIERMLHGEHCGYITPDFSLAKDFFDDMIDLIPPAIIQSSNKSRLRIILKTGGVIRFFSGEALKRLRGKKFHFIVVDEAAFIPDLKNAWGKVIRPTLTDYKGSAIFISTPNGHDYFNELYNKGVRRVSGFESFHFTSYDNPYLDKAEIDAAREELASAVFAQEYEAKPLSNKDNPFGGDSVIESNIIETLSTKPAVCFGIDVAKYGDFTVVTGIDEDGVLCYFDRFQLPWLQTIDRIKQLPMYTVKVVDRTGVGDVITEQLQASMYNVEGFLFTQQSKQQILFELIKDVETGNIKYNDEIASEMKTLEYKRTMNGSLSFSAKSGFFDDGVMSLAMCNNYRKRLNSSMSFIGA